MTWPPPQPRPDRQTPAPPPPSPPPRRGPGERPYIAATILLLVAFVGAVAAGIGLPDPPSETILEEVLLELEDPAPPGGAAPSAGPAPQQPDGEDADGCARETVTDAYGLPVEIERC